jgi:hypothetical protein
MSMALIVVERAGRVQHTQQGVAGRVGGFGEVSLDGTCASSVEAGRHGTVPSAGQSQRWWQAGPDRSHTYAT